MNERTKLIFSGIWVTLLTIVSVWLLSLFQNEPTYQLVILVWAFAWLSGMQFSSYCSWVGEHKDTHKVNKNV